MTDAELQEVADALPVYLCVEPEDAGDVWRAVYPIARRKVLLDVCRELEKRASDAKANDSNDKPWAALNDASWAIGHPEP